VLQTYLKRGGFMSDQDDLPSHNLSL